MEREAESGDIPPRESHMDPPDPSPLSAKSIWHELRDREGVDMAEREGETGAQRR
jgi:hypothetical protein